MFEEYAIEDKAEKFGTYRVELVVTLFSRVLDVHNFDLVMLCLTPKEVGCIYCRIGWLKLYNPMKPEGSFSLNIGYHDERQVAKILCGLAILEPGDNWIVSGFRWDYDSDPVPGVTLTESKKGLFSELTIC
jgi:hypothetical protein